MARQVNLAPFRKFIRDIDLSIIRSTNAYMERVVEKIRKEVTTLNSGFFNTMVSKGIDQHSAPQLQEFTPVWKELSNRKSSRGGLGYRDRKQKKYPGAGFFRYTGQLKRSLSQAKGVLLGQPVVELVKRPKSVREPNPVFKLNIQPAPGLRNLRGINLLEAINSGSQQRSMKLSTFRGRITRPLLQPYLSWWVKYIITPSVMRRLK